MITTTKLKNGTVTLPKNAAKSWKNAEIAVLNMKDTIILKKIEKTAGKLSDLAPRISSRSLSPEEIQAEIQAYRKSQ